MAVCVQHFCNYSDSSRNHAQMIHQNYSALSGWSDTTYFEKAQGDSIFQVCWSNTPYHHMPSTHHSRQFVTCVIHLSALYSILKLNMYSTKTVTLWQQLWLQRGTMFLSFTPYIILQFLSPVWRVAQARWDMCGCYVSTCLLCITLQGLLLWGTDSNQHLFNRAVVSNYFEFRVVLKHLAEFRPLVIVTYVDKHTERFVEITKCIKLLKQNRC